MKIIKKYTAIQVYTERINNHLGIKLGFGKITGPYYDQTEPTQEFDTEVEAIDYAYKFDKWARWLIVPVITFDIID